jgi:hypothetical protein
METLYQWGALVQLTDSSNSRKDSGVSAAVRVPVRPYSTSWYREAHTVPDKIRNPNNMNGSGLRRSVLPPLHCDSVMSTTNYFPWDQDTVSVFSGTRATNYLNSEWFLIHLTISTPSHIIWLSVASLVHSHFKAEPALRLRIGVC